MTIPQNSFKRALLEGRQQVGLWCSLPGSYVAEAVAGSGFDWLLFDTEHSPGDPLTVLSQLQAVAPYAVSPVVRPASNDTVLIKRFLDIGAQTLLVPYVQNADEARQAVAAMRYPPAGVRGVSGLTRATRFGRAAGYAERASEELCLLVQIETVEALASLEEIAAVEGVDGAFIGPADLAASLGHVGEPGHPDVVAAVEDAIRRIRACGKPAGILTPDTAFAERCITLGTTFTAVAIDVGILARTSEKIAAQFKSK
ncbi:4-hydroxy-2-oxoheptanedioate aldolase [Microvirga mediterraneensis]|uniref:4-hydroxy-2-oxoheptanedioate aldolase n=1 Tax=Microvirga mediterraneensis TaxID=2754695 RepID=A0A838BND5_9HYPH|nr:4-hydroxy-2-oxoheptanedioate aldolase [Microvirga mediterraneensis]MBA1157047.1 4-hydroxy-2-oxoheptanedioate aldolase [Microvirga mediterraneensis]